VLFCSRELSHSPVSCSQPTPTQTNEKNSNQIENKFLDALCGYYKVDDEDELPSEIQEISLGEMFESDKSVGEIREKMMTQLNAKPWGGMTPEALGAVVSDVLAVLGPLIETARADAAAAEEKA